MLNVPTDAFPCLSIGKLEILKSLWEIKLFIMSQLSTHDSREPLWSSQVKSHLNSSDMFQFQTKMISSHSIWSSNSFIPHKLTVSFSLFLTFFISPLSIREFNLSKDGKIVRRLIIQHLETKKSLKSELKPLRNFTRSLYEASNLRFYSNLKMIHTESTSK